MVKHKKRILVFTTTFPRWRNDTVPYFVYDLSQKISKDYDVIVLAPHTKDAKTYEHMGRLTVYRYKYFWPYRLQKVCYGGGILPNIKTSHVLLLQLPFLIIAGVFSMWYVIKKEKINVIHAHWVIPGGLVSILYKFIFPSKISILITAHSSYYKKILAIFPIDLLYKFIMLNSTMTVAVSTDMGKKMSKLTGKNHKVLSMGVQVKEFLNSRPNQKIIDLYGTDIFLFVGRLVEEKGIYFLIECMRQLISTHPSIVLLVVGEGPEKIKLLEMIDNYNLSKNVFLMGGVPHSKIASYYKSAKLFIVPSQSESFGLVFAEAMVSDCLVIGSQLKSISDIIINGKTGFQIPTTSVRHFTKRLEYIIDHYNQYDELRKAGKLHIKKNYSWVNIAKKYGNIYKKL